MEERDPALFDRLALPNPLRIQARQWGIDEPEVVQVLPEEVDARRPVVGDASGVVEGLADVGVIACGEQPQPRDDKARVLFLLQEGSLGVGDAAQLGPALRDLVVVEDVPQPAPLPVITLPVAALELQGFAVAILQRLDDRVALGGV